MPTPLLISIFKMYLDLLIHLKHYPFLILQTILPAIITRTGRVIKALKIFTNTAHLSIHAFLSTFFPPSLQSNNHSIQFHTANYLEPHPLALLGTYIFSFMASDPDTSGSYVST